MEEIDLRDLVPQYTLSRYDIMQFPFPYKLWLIVNMESYDFFRWNRDGTVVLVDLNGLEDYLHTCSSVFKIKNLSCFLQHLEDFKFDRLTIEPDAGEDILLQYQHGHFQRHRMDLLANIRRSTYQDIGSYKINESNSSMNKEHLAHPDVNRCKAQRILDDVCFANHGRLSEIQKSRLNFLLVMNFENETNLLNEKLMVSHKSANISEDDNIIELSADLFENPVDSVLNINNPEYAGYYGINDKQKLGNFFGAYLPMYDGVTTDICKEDKFNSLSNNSNETMDSNYNYELLNQQPSCSNQIEMNECIAGPAIQELHTALPNVNYSSHVNYSSELEPIFKIENNQENAIFMECIPQTTDDDVELSMEEFIKFKDPLELNNENGPISDHVKTIQPETANSTKEISENMLSSLVNEQYPQMPVDVKLGIENNLSKGNDEANFRSFFSQYRASLNVLNERN
ncbi:uncharacterized protein LOC142229647 [Haematobia irritans]|uniref:uncharacterized protein LOC142229647 n=1 Tax=Haematobia irritans TaxID=7368 RepID=UPI003F508A90